MIAPIAPAGTTEWHTLRRSGIGASESAAACGLSRYDTPVDVFNWKLGRSEKKETRAMRRGTAMEPFIKAEFELETGLRVEHAPGLFRHPCHAWMLASPDGVVDPRTLVEFKDTNRGAGLGEPGTDQLPVEWLLQAQQQMAVLEADQVLFGVMVDDDLRIYPVHRCERLITAMTDKEAALWDCIRRGTPPAFDPEHDSALDAIQDAFRHQVSNETVDLDDEAERLWNEYVELNCTEREKRRKVIKAELLARIGKARVAQLPSGERLTRNVGEDYDVAAHRRKGSITLTSNIKVR